MHNLVQALSTQLPINQEIAYQIAKYNSPFRYDSENDYDLRGFYNAYGTLQPTATNGHLTDEYKLPMHDTFSTQSKYYTINPEGYTYLPDRIDVNFIQNGLQPYSTVREVVNANR